MSLRDIAKDLQTKMQCRCDLDNWEPDTRTGHTWVCPIHTTALVKADLLPADSPIHNHVMEKS